QKRLATWMTRLVHGEQGVESAERATKILFGGEIESVSDAQLSQIFADVPSVEAERSRLEGEGWWIVEALQAAKLATSSSDARRAIKEGSVYLNNRRVADFNQRLSEDDLASETVSVLRRGKRKYALIRFT
ncbi:MAG: S4 domain-containing protein, partial [Novipirellula sp. JB048]